MKENKVRTNLTHMTAVSLFICKSVFIHRDLRFKSEPGVIHLPKRRQHFNLETLLPALTKGPNQRAVGRSEGPLIQPESGT